MAILGIDFGSSYTTVSWINPRDGRPTTVKFNGDGSVKCPSVIMGTESGLEFGFQAKSYIEEIAKLPAEQRIEKLSDFIPSLKRILNVSGKEYIGSKNYTHGELLEEFFKYIMSQVKADCGSESNFDEVVISHPVDFEQSNIDLLRQSLKKVGFTKVSTKFEPIAAVLGYSIDHSIKEGEGIMVFDFGGGTIDVAYVKKVNGELRLLCEPKGNKSCGGQDLDMLLYEDLRRRIKSQYNVEISQNMVDLVLLNSCRRLKESFSGKNDIYDTPVLFINDNKIITFQYKLNRDTFNNIIRQKVGDAIAVAEMVTKDLRQKNLHIDKVLLIGGSSQLTLVRELLSTLISNATIDTCGSKDVAVALGNIVDAIEVKRESPVKPNLPTKKEDDKLPLDRSRSMKCKKCGSTECYHLVGKRGYHCTKCGWEGVNVTVIKEL